MIYTESEMLDAKTPAEYVATAAKFIIEERYGKRIPLVLASLSPWLGKLLTLKHINELTAQVVKDSTKYEKYQVHFVI